MRKMKEIYGKDSRPMIAGHIEAWWMKDGERVRPAAIKPNVVTYAAADVMARLLSGDLMYTPRYVGYLFGPAAATMNNPETASPKRSHTWQDLSDDLEAITGNMVISPLATNPLVQVDGSTNDYAGNSTTLVAISDRNAGLVFSGGGFAGVGPQPTTDKYFQVALLSKITAPGTSVPQYIPFARSQLVEVGNDGLVVQADFELAVFWTITFK